MLVNYQIGYCLDPADVHFFVLVSKIPVGRCPLRAAQGQQSQHDQEDTALFTTGTNAEPRGILKPPSMPSEPTPCSGISSPSSFTQGLALPFSLNHTSSCLPIWTPGLLPTCPALRLCSQAWRYSLSRGLHPVWFRPAQGIWKPQQQLLGSPPLKKMFSVSDFGGHYLELILTYMTGNFGFLQKTESHRIQCSRLKTTEMQQK